MPVGRPRFVERTTRKERQKQRQNIILYDAAISERTQERYYNGVRLLMPILDKVSTAFELDDAIADWVELQWKQGQSLYMVNDALCGLHHFEPYTKRLVPSAWKLFRTWRKLESPNRAPPLTKYIIYSVAHYAIAHNDLIFGMLLLLGFFALLRTGELLLVKPCNCLISKAKGLLTLEMTKTGKRDAATESVAFDDEFTLMALAECITLREKQQLTKVPFWTPSAQNFRSKFRYYMQRFNLEQHAFRPYSLRRGGATALFQDTGSMEMALLKGRWQSARVAKIYLTDGLSFLPGLTFSNKAQDLLTRWKPF